MTVPASNDGPRNIPSLDGLRAISIALVLVGHEAFRHTAGDTKFFFGHLASLGVRVFFVISGFLITHLLLTELARTGAISLNKFYVRRTLRIFPPYYAFLLCMVALTVAGAIDVPARDFMFAAAYVSDYQPDRTWYLGHTWSLAVEEQFYLVWPVVMVLVGRRGAMMAASAVVLLGPGVRLLLHEINPGYEVGRTFETVADSLAIGCLLAGLRPWLHSRRFYTVLTSPSVMALMPLLILACTYLQTGRPNFRFVVSYTAMNFGIALLIDWCVTHHATTVGRVLNARPLVVLGVGSYSVYLWQQLFFARDGSWYATFPLNFIFIGLAAAASYFVIERPSLAAREKLVARLKPRRGSDALTASAGETAPRAAATFRPVA